MNRRGFLAGLGLAALLGRRASGRTREFAAMWTAWRDRFLDPAGRIVDVEQDGISHSEG